MRKLQEAWRRLTERFNVRPVRERALIAAAIIGSVLLVGNALLVDPLLLRARQALRQGGQQTAEADGLAAQAGTLRAQLANDPDAPLKGALAGLQDELRTVEGRLKALEARFVPPEQMTDVLENLLASHARLRLVSLRSLPPANLANAGKKDEAAAALPEALGLYKHGVEMRVEGSYADLYAWLAQLEAAQRKLLWGDIRFTVVEHPRSQLTLTIYTLSTDRSWLAI